MSLVSISSAFSALGSSGAEEPIPSEAFAAAMAMLGTYADPLRLAVAVSGGADSLALTLLAADWAQARGGAVVALTVDHRLRPESTAEAEQVGAWLAARGLEHHILTWNDATLGPNLAERARAARYALLEEWCATAGKTGLLLAHHQDDQAETVLSRLIRGSGLDGLGGMHPVVPCWWGARLRPLLGVSKARLIATLRQHGQAWIEDPSNHNPKTQRARLRQILPLLAQEGLTAARLAQTATHLRRAQAALEPLLQSHWNESVTLHPAGFAWLVPDALATAPAEIGLRILARLLWRCGGGDHPPRFDGVERLWTALQAGQRQGWTLAGCVIAPRRGRLLICRERAGVQPSASLTASQTAVIWDRRFRIRLARPCPGGRIVPLAERGRSVPAARRPDWPACAHHALPALIDDQGQLLAVPGWGWDQQECADQHSVSSCFWFGLADETA